MKKQSSIKTMGGKVCLALLIASVSLPAQIFLPVANKAVYLGWGSWVTTGAVFSQFFHSGHTLSAWVMPQYSKGYQGTVFGNVQRPGDAFPGQTLNIGLGHLDDGLGGHPHLMVQLGNQVLRYYYPKIESQKWLHLAVTRSGNVLHLYANGEFITPANFAACQSQGDALRDARNNLEEAEKEGAHPILITALKTLITGADANLNGCLNTNWLPELHIDPAASGPLGVLQIGRTRAKDSDPLELNQFYGLVDDVAVFNRTLTPNEIAAMYAAKRLKGNESNLIYAASFDKSDGIFVQPPILNSPKTLNAAVWDDVAISSNRNNTDAEEFENPYLIEATTVTETLPLPQGEVWKVLQGYDRALGTHKGSAEFSYDLVKPPMTGVYPFGTIFAPIKTPVAGALAQYKRVDTMSGISEDTWVALRRPNGAVVYFRHLDAIPDFGGLCNPTTHECVPAIGQVPTIAAGTLVGVVGNRGKHLHTGARNRVGGVTIPVSYESFWLSDDGVVWRPVWRGIPKTGQFVKRM